MRRLPPRGHIAILVLTLTGAACRASQATASDTQAAPPPDQKARVARGEYLVTVSGCHDCHSPWNMTERGVPEPDLTRALSGHPEGYEIAAPAAALDAPWTHSMVMAPTNTAFSGPWGVSFAANLTPDQNTGLGIWTEDIFIKALRTGWHYGVSRPILPPMPWPNFAKMTDEDLKSIYTYLRSLAPIGNRVPEPIPPAGARQTN